MRARRLFALLPLALALKSGLASGAARARPGGTLSLGLVGLAAPGADTSLDSPEAASARALLALPLCRLLPGFSGPVPVLASLGAAGTEAEAVQVVPRAEARFPDGRTLRAGDVASSWQRLLEEDSPYLALLAPIGGLAEALQASARAPEAPLALRLLYPWPDLEASLCHPAFTPSRAARPGVGPAEGVSLYAPGPAGRLLAARGAPGGPPFPSALAFVSLQARAAGRALQRGEVQAVLGEGPLTAGPLLFATYLVYRREGLPPGARAALEAVDVEALVRTFVPGPAAALHSLLPAGLLPGTAPPAPPARPPPGPASLSVRPFTLGYEAGAPEQRAVAERLQVLLHDAGYPVRLHADSRAALLRARRAGTLEAALVSLLLPPVPAAALALLLGLSEDRALLARELPGLGAEKEAGARALRTAQRASALSQELSVLPLYVRGLRAGLSATLVDSRRDGFGLLLLDDAWLAP